MTHFASPRSRQALSVAQKTTVLRNLMAAEG